MGKRPNVQPRAGHTKHLGVTFIALLALLGVSLPAGATQAETREQPTDAYIVLLEPTARVAAVAERLEDASAFQTDGVYSHAIDGFSAELTATQVDELERDPAVESVVRDGILRAAGGEVPVATGDTVPTGVRRIGTGSLTGVHGKSTAGVAVLDTGVDPGHPDLVVGEGKNCVEPGVPPSDVNGHGTHVAGTIAARNNGSGVTGVAPGTPIVPVKVLDDEGWGTWSDVICGIDWVTATRTDSDPTNDIHVVNMSIGGPGYPVEPCATTPDALHRAICRSTATGVNYVVAAGNDAWDFDHPDVPDVPAAYPEVLTVTAVSDADGSPGALGGAPGCDQTESDDERATFSNYAESDLGASHTLAAPGVCIRSTTPGGTYGTWSGTSMAAPHVAGVVALCVAEEGRVGSCNGMTPRQTIDFLVAEAEGASLSETRGFYGDPNLPIAPERYGYMVTLPAAPQPPEVVGAELFRAHVARVRLDHGTAERRVSAQRRRSATQELRRNDGSRYSIVANGRGRVAWKATFADVPPDAERMKIRHRGASTKRCAMTLSVRKATTGRWKALATWANTRTEKARSIGVANIASIRSAEGDVLVRLKCRSTRAFTSRTNVLRLDYAVGTPG